MVVAWLVMHVQHATHTSRVACGSWDCEAVSYYLACFSHYPTAVRHAVTICCNRGPARQIILVASRLVIITIISTTCKTNCGFSIVVSCNVNKHLAI